MNGCLFGRTYFGKSLHLHLFIIKEMCSYEKSWEFSQTRFSTMDKKHPDFSVAILKFTAMDLS